jgi:glucose-6-phosphate-specific signal transduction histidine kinase
MGAFFRDYGTSFALAIAALNTIISLVVGQFFKDSPRWRIALVVASVALIGLGVGASFYSQHQIVASAKAEVQKRLDMKDLLHAAIGDNETCLESRELRVKMMLTLT